MWSEFPNKIQSTNIASTPNYSTSLSTEEPACSMHPPPNKPLTNACQKILKHLLERLVTCKLELEDI